MKKIIIISAMFVFMSININAQTVSTQDSLALVALYNSTDGANWYHNDNWLTGDVDTWYGITVSNGNVTEIQLSYNHLSGSIPPEIGNLSNLTLLDLSDNQLSGSIPPEVGDLSSLTTLILSYNGLSGDVPNNIWYMTNLTDLSLGANFLTGNIPPEIGNLTNLTTLGLFWNQFTGSIPSEIGNLHNLQALFLEGNQLSGTIPSEIWNLTNLEFLYLGGNQFSGNIPPEIGSLTNLIDLSLNYNQLNGSIPQEMVNLTNLEYLFLNDNQFDEILSDLSFIYAQVELQNNNFDFGDLETANIHSIFYFYAPQAKIGTEENHNVNIGDNLTLSIVTGGTNNTYQWYKDGSAISGATSNTLSLNNIQTTDAGVYTCEVRNTSFPDLTLTTENYNVNIGTGGVNDINKNEISIYPNPTHSYFVLKSDIEINAIKIYNNSGQLVLETGYKEKIDISKLGKGIYFVKTFAKDNKRIGVQKLIVK